VSSTLGPAHATIERGTFDEDVETAADDGTTDDDFSGWWCIATLPFPCPAAGCDFVANHVTAAHRIVVWPDQDDRALLSCARDAREYDRNPKIVEYEPDMGACIAYDRWKQIGSPVHGRHGKPKWWDEKTSGRL
jgi:hypothetical protein